MENSTRMEGNTFMWVTGFPTESEKAGWDATHAFSYPNPHPGSVFIATTGTMWNPGCWEKVIDMLMYTRRQGLSCWLMEILDPHTTDPYANIDRIRDAGVLKAKLAAFNYTCLIDCDVEPKKNMLLELLKYDLPIVGPYIPTIDDEGVDKGVSVGWPQYAKGDGLKPVKWLAMSFVLFRTTVFNCVDNIFQTAVAEGAIFEKFWYYGHRTMIDTDLELKLASPATRFMSKSWDERQDWFREVDAKRKQTPDRMPLDPSCPYIKKGVYAPFLIESKEELEGYYSYLERKTQPLLVSVGGNGIG